MSYLPAHRSPNHNTQHLPIVDLNIDPETCSILTRDQASLLPFQVPAIRQLLKFLITHGMKGTLNAYDSGLGKSCMSIALANTLKSRRTLVICPAAVRGSWEQEIRTFATVNPLAVRTIYHSRNAENLEAATWIVTSYSMLIKQNVFEVLAKLDFGLLIVDESQALSNLHTKQTRAVFALWNRARKATLLSGTPIRRCTTDIFPSCHLLMPDIFPDYYEFAEHYAQRRSVPWGIGYEYYGGQNLKELNDIIKANFFTRRTKEEVLPDLPKKTYQKIVLDCGKFDLDLSNEEAHKILQAIDLGEDPVKFLPKQKKDHISKVRIEAGIKTLKAGQEFIVDRLENNEPIVLFAYHHIILNAAMQLFEKYKPVILDGSVTGTNKDKAIAAFRDGSTNLFIAQIQAAGVGINGLQNRCSTAIFAEWSYSPSDINQAMDRLCRIGQLSSVNGYFLVAKDSIDERVLDIVIKKERIIKQVITSTE